MSKDAVGRPEPATTSAKAGSIAVGEARLRDVPANRRLVEHVHPSDWPTPTPRGRYDLLVLGGGTGGLVSAAVAAGLGARVALVERSLLGGDCLNVGCVPSKALLASASAAATARSAQGWGIETDAPGIDGSAIFRRIHELRAEIASHDAAGRFRELGVDVFLGHGRFVAPQALEVDGLRLSFRRAVIATGAEVIVPPIEGLAEAGYLTNEEIFELSELPASLAVIGSGAIGCEMAQAFARLGVQVTLLEVAPRVLPREDAEAAAVVAEALAADGVRIEVAARVQRVAREDGRVRVEWRRERSTEAEGLCRAERLLLATGRRPRLSGLGLADARIERDQAGALRLDDRLRTTNRRVYAVGDVALEQRFTHAADATARMVVRNALFAGRGRVSDLRLPRCTYTDPELAHVGPDLYNQADEDASCRRFQIPFADVDRARLEAARGATPQGFARIYVPNGDDRVLGATIIGPHAGELISQVALAMRAGLGLGDLSNVVYPYPTRAEILRKLGDTYQRGRLTPLVGRLIRLWLRLSRRLLP